MTKKGFQLNTPTVVLIVAVMVLVAFSQGWITIPNIQFPNIIINNPFNPSGNATNTNTNNTVIINQPANELKPTSLTVIINPNPVVMGRGIVGQVSSNGYNYPIICYAKFLGTGEIAQIAGLLGSDGKYALITQLNTPGYWQAYAVAGGVQSNIASFTCEGIKVSPDKDVYSRMIDGDFIIKFYSHMVGAGTVVARKDGTGAPVALGAITINSGGYGAYNFNLSGLAVGFWELDLQIGGQTAKGYGGEAWVEVIR
jgi:hypothetical protein